MSKNPKLSKEIRERVLKEFRNGKGYFATGTALALENISVSMNRLKRWMVMYRAGDLSWVDGVRKRRTVEEAWAIVNLYREIQSSWEVARRMNCSDADVLRYVNNTNLYGHPFKARGRPKSSEVDMTATKGKQDQTSLSKEEKSYKRKLEEVTTVLNCLLEQIENCVDIGSKKKASCLTRQLRNHIKKGYPLPDLANCSIPRGAAITDVLTILAREFTKSKYLPPESRISKKIMSSDSASSE